MNKDCETTTLTGFLMCSTGTRSLSGPPYLYSSLQDTDETQTRMCVTTLAPLVNSTNVSSMATILQFKIKNKTNKNVLPHVSEKQPLSRHEATASMWGTRPISAPYTRRKNHLRGLPSNPQLFRSQIFCICHFSYNTMRCDITIPS